RNSRRHSAKPRPRERFPPTSRSKRCWRRSKGHIDIFAACGNRNMKLVMMGTGAFAEPTFLKLLESPFPVVGLVTQPDRAAGKERGSTRQAGQPMKELAHARGIPVLQPESINTPEGVASLKALDPALLVVAAYGQILSKDALAAAPLGG